ncbi:MAG TPA: hypothetical protein VL326_19635, partial [Kofleriaceae bacterium]|nr:hypothetical protein [Kofleriaceae bacterium]
RTDGLPFTDRVDDLVMGMIFYPPDHDEHGVLIAPEITLTGTNQSGGLLTNCSDFSNPTQDIYFGVIKGTSHAWTHESNVTCTTPGAIYCFGITESQPVSVRPVTGRTAFVTAQNFVPDAGGIGSADALCQSEASAAGLGGTYRALLATTTADAMSRFSLAGANWVRTDGVPLAASTLDFANGLLTAPLNVSASRTYRIINAYTGAMTVKTPAVATDNCNDWTSTTGNARIGLPSYIDDQYFYVGYMTGTCAAGKPIYCLEE